MTRRTAIETAHSVSLFQNLWRDCICCTDVFMILLNSLKQFTFLLIVLDQSQLSSLLIQTTGVLSILQQTMEINAEGAHQNVESQQRLLSEFLKVQEQRAGLYAMLQSGFTDYLKTGSEVAFQQLCGRITTAFNDCSRQVIDIQTALREPDIGRQDLADILKDVQAQEKQNLKMTATLQVLRKAGKPSDRAQAHADEKVHHQCSHSHEEESSALELAEADAEFDAAYKEATQTLQEARTAIHEYMEEVRYELASSGVA